MEKSGNRNSFTGSIGFVLAAAGSAVGLGNIWRFPYLAARDGGGTFLFVYIILALTFGFTLLITEVAIGRKTKQSPLTAYGVLRKKWRGLGVIASLVPAIILPYYCVIGGWVVKYLFTYLTFSGAETTADGYFTSFISEKAEPVIMLLIFVIAVAFIVYRGVNKGIERISKILMPILLVLVIVIAVFSITISHTDESGITRTGFEGLGIYLIPDFKGMTLQKFMSVIMDAMGQLFFAMVLFAALTSGVSIMETVVSCFMDKLGMARHKAVVIVTLISTAISIVVCFGYNLLYFNVTLPTGAQAQLLDILDYISNNLLMPIVAIATCILVGWIIKPKTVIDEVEKTKVKMGRKTLYRVMIRYIAPAMLAVLFTKSLGIF